MNTLNTLLSQPGTYQATLTVSAAGFPNLPIPLTFEVGGALAIIPSPTSLTFNAPPQPASQTITLAGYQGAGVGFTLASDSPWLSVTTNQSVTPAVLTVTATLGTLAGATYQGNITVVPSQGIALTIPVTFQVGANTLTATPASLAFAYTQGGTTPPAQALALTSQVSGDTYTAQAASTGNWLLLNGVTTPVSGSLPVTLNVTVNGAGLAPNTYTGAIVVTDPSGGTLSIAVTLTVSTISTIANPTSLIFVAQAATQGSAPPTAPSPQTVAVNQVFNDLPYTAAATGTWLTVSPSGGPTPAQVTIRADPTGLGPGTYSGSVAITANNETQNIQATLILSANPVLITNPGEFILQYFGGDPVPTPLTLAVNVSSGVLPPFIVASGVPSWLQISPTGSSLGAPTNLTVAVAAETVPTGTYLAQVILSPAGTDGAPAVGGDSIVVPVLLFVDDAPAVVATPKSVSLTGAAGSGPQSSTVELTANPAASFSASMSTVSGGTWLSVSPTSGNTGATGTRLTVTADATNLVQGTYQGTVTVTTGGGVATAIPVTFTVNSSIGPVTISASTLAFMYGQNGTLPAAQSLQITGSESFAVSAGTSSGGNWLAVTPTTGTGNVTLSVSVVPAVLTGLAPAVYNGTITVTPTGGVPQTVAVTLTVQAPGSLTFSSNPPVFTYTAGGALPAAQTLSITSMGENVTFTAAAQSSGWLAVTPTSATTPASLSVSVNPANLGAGQYLGSIALSANGGTLQLNVSVTLTVIAPLPVITTVVNSASYLPGGISPGEIVTVFGSAIGPATGVLAAIDSRGYIETSLANVTVTFNGYAAPILYAYTGQINAIAPYELASASNVSVEVTFGSARSNLLTFPVVFSAPGVFSDDASGQGEGAILDENYQVVSASNPVSGGTVIQIFATGQGQTSPAGVNGLIEPLTLPLPAPLLTPAVTIGGVQATLQYAGAAPGLVAGALQVNAYVPDGLPSGAAPLVVSFGGVGYSQPGITVAIK